MSAISLHLLCLHEIAENIDSSNALAMLDDNERVRLSRACSLSRYVEILYGRTALKKVISAYLGVSPADLSIANARSGKPFLRAPAFGNLYGFNVSHSVGMLAIAISSEDTTLGVDLERWTPELAADCDALAQSHLTELERADYMKQCIIRRSHFFLQLWTMKEAALKATGIGLHVPLQRIKLVGRNSSFQCKAPDLSGEQSINLIHRNLGKNWHLSVASSSACQLLKIYASPSTWVRLNET